MDNSNDKMGVTMIEMSCTNAVTLEIVANILSEGYEIGGYNGYTSCPRELLS